MKLKKEIGNESVRDIILEARARAALLPRESIQDPWPSSSDLEVKAIEVKLDSEAELDSTLPEK